MRRITRSILTHFILLFGLSDYSNSKHGKFQFTLNQYSSSGGSGHDFTLTLSEYTQTVQNSSLVSSNNTNSYCGITDWVLNTAHDVAGKTCGGSTLQSIGTAYYGIYILDGSKLFWTLSSDAYNDSVPTGDNDTFTKQ